MSGFPFRTPKRADTAFLPGNDPRFLNALADSEGVTIAYLGHAAVIAAEQLDELWKLYVDETNWRLDEQGSPYIGIGKRVVLIYGVGDGGETIGASAVGRDLTGALSIIEQGGPCNASLPVIVQRAVQRWIGQANADASRSA